MNFYKFYCCGHEKIISAHRNTLEFTKDDHLTEKGDCIIGLKCDFEPDKIRQFIKNKDKIGIMIKANNKKDMVKANINHAFNNGHEIVIRKSIFVSERTLGINADKAAKDLDKELIKELKNPEAKIEITLKQI